MLSDIVNVVVSTQAVTPQQAGFGEMLLLSPENPGGSALVGHFKTLAAVASAGYSTTGPTYLAAQKALSQNPGPVSVAIGRLGHLPTQHFTITPTAVGSAVYNLTVGGSLASFTAGSGSPTLASVCTGIAAAITALAIAGVTAASTGTTVTVSLSAAGSWIQLSPGSFGTLMEVAMDAAATTFEAADMNAIALYDSSWYGVVNLFPSAAINAALASWVEANKKFFIADSQDTLCADQPQGSGSDIAQTLKASAYARSGVAFHPDNSQFLAAAWMGARLPMQPGSENWMFANLPGVSAPGLSASQVANLQGKSCNYYYPVIVGTNIAAQGTTAAGSFFDLTRGQDWLVSRLSTRVVSLLTSTGSKVPYTDAGIAMIEDQVRAQMQEAIANGYLAASPAPVVTSLAAASQNPTDRSNRIVRGITFKANAQGAVNNVNVSGTVLL